MQRYDKALNFQYIYLCKLDKCYDKNIDGSLFSIFVLHKIISTPKLSKLTCARINFLQTEYIRHVSTRFGMV